MAEVHYSDSEPILPHEEVIDELEDVEAWRNERLKYEGMWAGKVLDDVKGPVGYGLKEGGKRVEVAWLRGRSCLLVWRLHVAP